MLIVLIALIGLTHSLDCETFMDDEHASLSTPLATPLRVAVIGAGIGGAATSYFVKRFLQQNVTLHVFEASDRVGGRIEHVTVRDDDNSTFAIELGASIWVPQNRFLQQYSDKFQLEKRKKKDTTLGIFDGEKFRFESSSWQFVSLYRMLMRYGLAPFYVQRLTAQTVAKFVRFYDFKTFGGFDSPRTFLNKTDLFDLTQTTLETYLQAKGISQTFIDEIASVATRVNYNQEVDKISAFAGLITLVAMGNDALQLVDGNVELVKRFLRESDATVELQSAVNNVSVRNGGWLDKIKTMVRGSDDKHDERPLYIVNGKEFDAVVVATPLETGKIQLPLPSPPQRRTFVTTHATLVVGKLSGETFGVDDEPPASVMSIGSAHPSVPFVSIAEQYRFRNGTAVYKVFARQAMTDAVLQRYFERDARVLTARAWRAYPNLQPSDASQWPSFELAPNLFYANAMESIVSTMETSVAAAHQVARQLCGALQSRK